MTAQQKDLFTKRWRQVPEPQSESAFHIQLVATLRWALRPDVLMRHVPNGEARDPRTAAKLKAMGVLPGCADLEFHWAEPLYEFVAGLTPPSGEEWWAKAKSRRILHLELKRPGRKQSLAQIEYAFAVRVMGDEYLIARSIDDALELLRERGLLNPKVNIGRL